MKNYDDIIQLPHWNPKTHSRMSLYNRAAQFSPFKALTGHDAAIEDTAHIHDSKEYGSIVEEKDWNEDTQA